MAIHNESESSTVLKNIVGRRLLLAVLTGDFTGIPTLGERKTTRD
jgi:hypothetical protein